MIRRRRWSEYFCKYRLQSVGPDLIASEAEVQFVDGHALEQGAVFVGKFVVEVEETNPLPVGKLGDVVVEAIDRGNHRHAVVARENRGENDRRVRRLFPAKIDQRLDAVGDVGNFGVVAGSAPEVVGARKYDDDLGVYLVELAIFQPPENVLDRVRTPAEVGSIPTKEVLPPIG